MKPILIILFVLLHLGIIILFWKWTVKEDKKNIKNPDYPTKRDLLKLLYAFILTIFFCFEFIGNLIILHYGTI
ncbi:hypothetical protein [Spiroplasma endosymbiont of Villa modesta]|uniref:hypothetical protein n=1 Tax=Spiroplasma endosymbiont of Villa modesta TaxID=3066293 RepID=UPI00313B39A4